MKEPELALQLAKLLFDRADKEEDKIRIATSFFTDDAAELINLFDRRELNHGSSSN